MSRSAGATSIAVLLLLVGATVVAVTGTAAESTAAPETVTFTFVRTGVAQDLEFELECDVTVDSDPVYILNGASTESPVFVQPLGCSMAVYILGVRVPIPLTSLPLGTKSVSVLGVAGLNLLLVDVTVDFTTSLASHFAADHPGITISSPYLGWTDWGMQSLTLTARLPGYGNHIRTTIGHRLSYHLGMGVSVRIPGLPGPILSWEFVDLGLVEGHPEPSTPLIIDLKPTPAAGLDFEQGTNGMLTVSWTQNADEDFGRYLLQVKGPSGDLARVFDGRGETAVQIQVEPGAEYSITLVVEDRAGQVSDPAVRTILVEEGTGNENGAIRFLPVPALAGVGLDVILLVGAIVGIVLYAGRRRRNNIYR